MAMFQAPIKPSGTVHLEFRAGKCDWDGKRVTPQKTKGKVVLYTSEEDQLMHVEWHDREKNAVGDVKLLLIKDGYLDKVEKCKDGRVLILRMTTTNKKFFFWLQEPKAEGDDDIIKKFNETVGATIPEKKKGAAGAAPAEIDPALQAILTQFLNSQQQQQGQGAAATARTAPVPLSAVLTTEVLQGLTSDDTAMNEMMTLLPAGQQTRQDAHDALGSAQLQQNLQSLTQAIHSDQLPVLFTSLGLDPRAIMQAPPGSDALELLCRAMEEKESKK